jgi:GAF domain-containing protein/multidrug resistance efflux pump/putative methionine-R-sulfoxide reductase with GAF domain
MAEDESKKLLQLYRVAYSLIFCRTSVQDAFQTASGSLAKALQARNVILWLFSKEEGVLVPEYTFLEDKAIKLRNTALGSDYLGEAFRSEKPLFLTIDSFQKQNKHAQFPKDMMPHSGICVPFKRKPDIEGVIEVINKTDSTESFSEEDVEFLQRSMETVTAVVSNVSAVERQTANQLNAITRLTLLYDIGQIFNSTLELNQLLPIISEKIRDILDAGTCTIWLLNESGDSIRSGHSSGEYQELFAKYKAKLEEDIVAEVMNSEEGILQEQGVEDERLKNRLTDSEENPVDTYLAARLECKGNVIGVVELMNRVTEKPFDEEDLFLLNDLAKQAAGAVHNANLLQAERKAKELDALLKISHEITSTLNLDRVLLTIVNQAASLVPYDRAAISLIDRAKVELAAVSGKMELDKKSSEMKELNDILTWAARLEKGLYISEFKEKIVTDREENREKFKAYFEKTGNKSFISIPLKDEEGQLGILSFESETPYFLDERHLEVVSILANQATVAIRNAQLYRQVPLINIMEPIMQKKAAIMKMPHSRRMAWLAGLGLLLLMLIFVPWNMKVVGDVTILPANRTPVATQVEGIIKKVYYREGTPLKRGAVIASMVDNDYRLALEQYRTRGDLLRKEVSRSESIGDSVAARMKRIELDQVEREIKFYAEQLAKTNIVAPVDGVLVTPKLEEKVGLLLKKGEDFCGLADMNSPRGEISIEEGDTGYVKVGQRVRLKMNAFPTRKFYGTVTLLGSQMTMHSDTPYFRAEARIDNTGLLLKSGMAGKAKIEVGKHSIGYVLLREPVRFLWKKIWVWLP